MERLAAGLLFALLSTAACGSGGQQAPPQEPTPSNEAAGHEEGARPTAADQAAPDQPPGPTGTTGGSGSDRDGDGIRDDMDRCPDEPEDRDGFEDQDGCPEADNDQDGIVDLDDKCPAEPEAKNGRQDEDGCPD